MSSAFLNATIEDRSGLGVLVVDDEPVVLEQIGKALRRRGHDVSLAPSAEAATRIMSERSDLGVVVSDIRMPGEDGLGLARRITAADSRIRPEVVLITGHASVDDAAEAVRIGASDFIRKPLRSGEIANAVEAAMERVLARRRNLEAESARLARIAEAEEEARRQRGEDPLTCIANRAALIERLLTPRREPCGLVLIDLDRFRRVNEAFGPRAADALLIETARRIQQAAGRGALTARFGDDEFAVLVEGESALTLPALAARLHASVAQQLGGGDVRIFLTASVGYASSPVGDGAACLRGAEAAIRNARGRGGDRVASSDEARADGSLRRIELAGALRSALRGTEEIGLAYQPIMRCSDGQLIGFEALIRFNDPAVGRCDPDELMPVAEHYGLMDALGRRVLRDALSSIAAWRQEGLPFGRIAVNVSPTQLRAPDFAVDLCRMVSASGLPASVLCLEITESEALSEQALPALTALREAGFGLAIDDFGVGHSSLARLRDLPATLVKLDRRFVERLPGTERDRAFFRGMTQLTTALGLTTVAEGVETPAQLQALRDAGCDACQGYLLGAPMPSGDVAGFLRRGGLRI